MDRKQSQYKLAAPKGTVMPKRRSQASDIIATEESELARQAQAFVSWLATKNYRAKTISRVRKSLNLFVLWCVQRELHAAGELTMAIIKQYENYLLGLKDAKKQPISANNRHSHLAALAKFCWFLVQSQVLTDNPALKIVYPKKAHKLPKNVCSHTQIEHIISQADISSKLGVRDRTIMEVLYSTGMRRAELAGLQMGDLDLRNELVLIRFGKGGKSRLVPIGQRASVWVKEYLTQVRPYLCGTKQPREIFIGIRGKALTIESLGRLVARYVRKVGQSGACHIFRHAMATQMLENGASLRYIQQMLGHERLTTTQVYTHISITSLQQAYAQSHPAHSQECQISQEPVGKLRHYSTSHATGPKNNSAYKVNGIPKIMLDYLQQLRLANFSPRTIADRTHHLHTFWRWCLDRDLQLPSQLSPQILESYHRHLTAQKYQDRPLAVSYIQRLLLTIKYWCAYLAEYGLTKTNAAQWLTLPRVAKHIPCEILTPQELDSIMAQPDIKTHLGIRDRAILETLYCTGIRRQELIDLALTDVDFDKATLRIESGKGGKSRIIPIAPRALQWISKYLHQVRPSLADTEHSTALFLGHFGLPVCSKFLAFKVKQYMRRAGIEKKGSLHIFRHTMATNMLDNGADLRYIQHMLGHQSLDSTQIYTQVAIGKLKAVHAKTHPAKLKKPLPPTPEPG